MAIKAERYNYPYRLYAHHNHLYIIVVCMEVTFLSSTGSFGGVEYNLSKVMKNAGEIVGVQNFDGLLHISNPTIGDYTDYLKVWSEKNSRIKNTQFHVAISCKGQEKSKEELFGVAKQWLKQMGYDGIPALFVFHHDTDNNHIHIITSRVDPLGKKVSDSNERWKGRAILKRIEGVRLSEKEEANKAIEDALSYRFSNKKQFLMVLESKKYKVAELENGDVVITKYGRQVGVISNDKINQGLFEREKTEEENNREKQLKAILHKYKEKMSLAELKDLMRKSFGVELIFFGGKGKPYYGYAIIDHKAKVVHKGGDIMSLKELLGQRDKNSQDDKQSKQKDYFRQKGENLISLILESKKASTKEVNAILRKHGFSVRKGGVLFYYSKEIDTISETIKEQLDYNDRLARTRLIHTGDPRALEALARHFKVHLEDLSISQSVNRTNNKGYVSAQDLYDKAFTSGELFYYLKLYNAFIIDDQGQKFLVERETGSISEIDTSNPELSLVTEQDPYEQRELEPEVTIDDLTSLIMGNPNGQASSANNELKKRKRKR